MLLLLGLVHHPPTRHAELGARRAVAPRHAVQLRMAVDAAEPCQDEDAIKADAQVAFGLLDLDGNGEVSVDEFQTYMRQFRYTESAIDKIYDALDMDDCGQINLADLQDGLAEYCRCSKCEPKFVDEVHAEADLMFALVDANGDGAISMSELRAHLLSHGYTEPAVGAVWRSLDANSDGELSQAELRAGILKYSRLSQANVAVVTTLVKNKRWSPVQQKR